MAVDLTWDARYNRCFEKAKTRGDRYEEVGWGEVKGFIWNYHCFTRQSLRFLRKDTRSSKELQRTENGHGRKNDKVSWYD